MPGIHTYAQNMDKLRPSGFCCFFWGGQRRARIQNIFCRLFCTIFTVCVFCCSKSIIYIFGYETPDFTVYLPKLKLTYWIWCTVPIESAEILVWPRGSWLNGDHCNSYLRSRPFPLLLDGSLCHLVLLEIKSAANTAFHLTKR